MKIFLVIFLLVLCYLILISIDSVFDKQACKNEFIDISGQTPKSVYANGDSWRINVGKNIYCSVFWEEGDWLANVDFLSGRLTENRIELERYWIHPELI